MLLSGCSGWNVSLSDERTPSFRTLANISHFDDDKEALAFDIRKRDKSVMAERTFFQDGSVSASFIGGRHQRYRWMTGVKMDYRF